MSRLLFVVILLISATSVVGQPSYFPESNDNWATKSPTEFGLDNSAFQEAINFGKSHPNPDTKDLRQAILKGFEREPYHQIIGPTKKRGDAAGLVIKDGFIIAQWGDLNRVDMTFSVTKSYLSTVAGLAYDRGMIRDTDDLLIDYVWNGKFDGEHNAKISWHHLLNQSSDWSGELWGGLDWADRPPREGGIDDWKFRELREPGTHFEYNDVRVNLLAYSLLEVWRKPLPKVLKEHVMDPIDASSTWRWYGYKTSWVNIDGVKVQSVSGGGHSGGGLFINSFDHARFGLLFLANGRWKDKQIISEKWIKKASTPSEANENYGYMWWLNPNGTNRRLTSLSANAFYASGFGGNYIIVEPDHDLVIVLRWIDNRHVNDFLKLLLNSITK